MIESGNEKYKISEIDVKANSSVYCAIKNYDGKAETFFWNIKSLIPYSKPIKN